RQKKKDPAMIFLQYLNDALALKLFAFGGASFTVGSLTGLLVALVVLLVFVRWLRAWMTRRLLAHGHIGASTAEMIASLTRYAVLPLGMLLILEQAGIKLSSFTVLAGAL